MTAREQLEAFIWRAIRDHRVTCPGPVRFVDAVLRAADAYKATGGPPTVEAIAGRRPAKLTWTDNPTVHWQKPGSAPNTAVCHGRITRAVVTSLAADVNCGRCKQSLAWKAAS